MFSKLLFAIFFFIFSSGLHAQEMEEEVKPPKKKEIPERRWAASFSLGNIPVPQNPMSLQPGIEFYITPQFSLFNEISIQTGKHNHADSAALNKKYFKYKAEARFYFTEGVRGTPFFSLQFITAKRSFDIGKAGKFYETGDKDSVYTFSKASVNSPYQALSINFGSTKRIVDNFYIESSFGFGLRFVNTKYFSIENLQKQNDVGFFNIRPASSYRYNGRRPGTQINFNVRFFYTF